MEENEMHIEKGYHDEAEGESTTGKLTQFIALLFVTIVMAFLFLKIYYF
ncbi:MAG: hypothetical protein IPM72_13265 [Chitinophagaceae bacterium]|nr:hypothetical protein [Chitinophagaceae bacterium]